MPTLREQVDEIMDALSERVEWENHLAQSQAQRKCTDRGKINNSPWPGASNVRYPLSDTLIAQFTPFLFKILYSSERVAFFRALSAQNATAQGLAADWFDFKVKNDTDLEDEIQPCIDKMLQDGETLMKIMWHDERECFYFEFVDNLFFITPSTTLKLQDAPWCVHVLHKSKDWIRKRFKDVKGIEGFIDRVKDGDSHDQSRRDDNEYTREGISVSPKNKNIILWEKHYQDAGKHRIVTLSPDDPAFDFGDDREYQYEIGGYMFEHTKWEKIDKKMHSARGIPRLVMEGEFTLTALERFLQNTLTLTQTPLMYAQNQVPGSTQNISYQPGTFLPFPVEVVKMGQMGFELPSEIQRTREKWERRVGSPDYGIGKSNTQNDSRTATEVKAISFQQSQAVDLITGNWRMFLGKIFKKAWKYVVEANKVKPLKSLEFFLGGKNQVLPPEMLNDEWQITITGSAESVNRETMTQKAITLWQMCQNNPYANIGEAWKNVLQNLIPGEVDRFYQDPSERQQKQTKKTASDLSVIVSTGFPMMPDMTDDLFTAAVTAVQYLQGASQRGQPLNPQQVNLISKYIGACREMLRQSNKQAYAQLTQVLSQMEIENQGQLQLQAQQQAQAQAQPAQPAVSNIIPMKKDFKKSITLIRDAAGNLIGANVVGVESGEAEGATVEKKDVQFITNDGRVVGMQVVGVEQPIVAEGAD